MPIEVRQLNISTSVVEAEPADAARLAAEIDARLDTHKQAILDACKDWLETRLQQLRER